MSGNLYSAGKHLIPQRYVVAWPEGIVKAGNTWNGRRRWGPFLSRGAAMLDLATFDSLGPDLESEQYMHTILAERFPPAFQHRSEATDHLPRGGGWMECYAVPPEEFAWVIEVAAQDKALRGGK